MFTVSDSVLLRNKLFIATVMYQLLSKVNEPDTIASNSNIINLSNFLGKFSRQINVIFPRKQELAFGANCLHWRQFA